MRPIMLIAGIVLIAFVSMSGCGAYNNFVDQEAEVENAWSKVQNAYQRRADLIPNLVNTVKGVADFEKETLTSIVEARAKATQTVVDPSNITPDQIKAFSEAQGGLGQSLSRLLVTVENYPELKASENFKELQAQLEGTENRIKVARDRFNDTVTTFNKSVRRFPGVIFANMFGFAEKTTFEAQEGAENAPSVEF